MRRTVLYTAAWVTAVVLATVIALAAVRTVGDAARGRGPLGEEVQPLQDDSAASPGPQPFPTDESSASKDINGEFGTFVVACQGPYAVGVHIRPDRATGWRAVSFEPGPDDDVDAVFSDGRRSIEVEVFCDQGRPVVADIENSQLTDVD